MKTDEIRKILNKMPLGATFRQSDISIHFKTNGEKREICGVLLSLIQNGSVSVYSSDNKYKVYRVERHDEGNLMRGRKPAGFKRDVIIETPKHSTPEWAKSWHNVWKGLQHAKR